MSKPVFDPTSDRVVVPWEEYQRVVGHAPDCRLKAALEDQHA